MLSLPSSATQTATTNSTSSFTPALSAVPQSPMSEANFAEPNAEVGQYEVGQQQYNFEVHPSI